MNCAIRQGLELNTECQAHISDPGIVWSHPDKPRIARSDLFVYPDLRPSSGVSAPRVIRGNGVKSALSADGIYLVQGEAFSGKTALAKSVFRDLLMEDIKVPVLMDGSGLAFKDLLHFEKYIHCTYIKQFSNADLDGYLQMQM